MKHIGFLSLIACAASLAACESTNVANERQPPGTVEAKRLAALRQQQQEAQKDPAQQNLWSAQGNTLNRDGNPNRNYDAP
jgi:hypothetical protein